jgi:hypothetical protein
LWMQAVQDDTAAPHIDLRASIQLAADHLHNMGAREPSMTG